MSGAWTAARVDRLFDRLDTELDDAIRLRREIHAAPRLGGDEDQTTKQVLAALGDAGRHSTMLRDGGAIVRVGAGHGPAIGLRAELDALPVTEATTVPWRSTGGVMHACGHDVHLAGAVAVARTLHRSAGPLPLALVLQPREETLPSGAKDVVASATLEDHDIRAFVGVHVQPRLPQGCFSASPGPVNAAADLFEITVNGRPGHAAYPHLTADPVVAAAELVGTLQHLISRQVDPTHPTVLTVGSIEGGNSPNVVPARVRMSGILRTFDEHDRVQLHRSIGAAAEAVAGVHGCDAEVTTSLGAPVLDNDTALTAAAVPWLQRAIGTSAPPMRSCGADDFSYFCPLFPSLMVFVGVGRGGPDVPGLHHPAFLPPESSVRDVARAMLAAYLGGVSTVMDLPQG